MTPEELFAKDWGNPKGEKITALGPAGFAAKDLQRRQEQEAIRATRTQKMFSSRLRRYMRRGKYREAAALQDVMQRGGLSPKVGNGGIMSADAREAAMYNNRFPDEDSAWSKLSWKSKVSNRAAPVQQSSSSSGQQSNQASNGPLGLGNDSFLGWLNRWMGMAQNSLGATPSKQSAPSSGVSSSSSGSNSQGRQYEGPLVGFDSGPSRAIEQAAALQKQRVAYNQRGFVDAVRKNALDRFSKGEDFTQDDLDNMYRNAANLGLSSEQDREKLNGILEDAREKAKNPVLGPDVPGVAITNDPALAGTMNPQTGNVYELRQPDVSQTRDIPESLLQKAMTTTISDSQKKIFEEKRDEEAKLNSVVRRRAKEWAAQYLPDLIPEAAPKVLELISDYKRQLIEAGNSKAIEEVTNAYNEQQVMFDELWQNSMTRPRTKSAPKAKPVRDELSAEQIEAELFKASQESARRKKNR